MSLSERIRTWARSVKREAVALWFACKHPDTPLLAKFLCLFVVGYALSPIDLIPDFIPVLGYLDDVILLPGLIWLAIRMIPSPVVAECRDRADQWMTAQGGKPTSWAGAALIVAVWLGATFAAWYWLIRPWLGA